MNDNTITTTGEAGIDTTPQQVGKTFSQDELNKIVFERLQRERQKAETVLADRERELAQREFLLTAKSTLTDKGYPLELLDVLNCSDAESLEKCLEILDGIKHKKAPATAIYGVTGRTPMGGNSSDPVREAMGLKT